MTPSFLHIPRSPSAPLYYTVEHDQPERPRSTPPYVEEEEPPTLDQEVLSKLEELAQRPIETIQDNDGTRQLLELAKRWSSLRKDAVRVCPTIDRTKVALSTLDLFFHLCKAHGSFKWQDHFLEQFCDHPDDLWIIACRMIPKYPRTLLRNIGQFNFDEATREKLALKIIEKTGSSSALATFFPKCNDSEEQRYAILTKACNKLSESPNLYRVIYSASLLPHHLSQLAVRIGERVLQAPLLSHLDAFRFDPEKQKQFMVELREKNPAYLFEECPRGTCPSDLKEISLEQIPFYTMEEELKHLHTDFSYRYPALKEGLESLLKKLHILNKRMGLPTLFYLSCHSHSLRSLIYKTAERCRSIEELLDLMHLLCQNFFCGTKALLGTLLTFVVDFAPKLRKYVSIEQRVQGSFFTQAPYPILLGMHALLNEKYLRKPPLAETALRITTIDSLLKDFQPLTQNPDIKRGMICIEFPKKGHYSTLFFEKAPNGKILFVSTDSVIETAPKEFAGEIREKLSKAPFAHEFMIFSFQRQADTNSCPVFAFTDIFSVFRDWSEKKHTGIVDLFQDAGASVQQEWRTKPTKLFTKAPTHMMRLTQSLTKLSDRERETFTRHDGEVLTLKEYAEQHTFVFFDLETQLAGFRFGNLAAEWKLCRYIERITRYVLQLQRA